MRRNTKQHHCLKKICATSLTGLPIGYNASLLESLSLDFSRNPLPTHQQQWSTQPWNLPSGNTAITLCVQDGKACSSENLSLFAIKAASTTSSFSYQEKEKKTSCKIN